MELPDFVKDMKRFPYLPIFAALSPVFVPLVHADTEFYVDVTNNVANPQYQITSGYTYYPSYDNAGVGFSAGSGPGTLPRPARGDYYIADGFLGGATEYGLWQSWWLDAIWPAEDTGPHSGAGTPDIIAPGGIAGYSGTTPIFLANGLPAVPAGSSDSNGQYLGLAGGEYAVWGTPITVSSTTTFQYSYIWSPAGATLMDGTEFAVGAEMGAVFFVDTNTNLSDGGTVFTESSGMEAYEGAGLQDWITETGTFTLEPGTYYWGFTSEAGGPAGSYIGVEDISISPVPEPSGVLLAISGVALFASRRRRVHRA